MASKIDLIDLYAFDNDFDGSVIESLMEDSNITCRIKNCVFTRFETGDYWEKRVAVEQEKVENARRIISDAIKCGVVSSEGRFKA